MLPRKLLQSLSKLSITRALTTQCHEMGRVPVPMTYISEHLIVSMPAPSKPTSLQLPSTSQTLLKSILEPAIVSRFNLPASIRPLDKLTPTIGRLPVEIREPTNQEQPTIIKHSMPWLIGVRHRKMKKHKLRKFRKRMLFVFRKRKLMKLKKKEKEIVIEEDKYKKEGETFNARDFIEQEMALARKAGWGVNLMQNAALNK